MMYLVLKCPKCGKVGTGMTEDVMKYAYKCRRCNRQTKLKRKRSPGLRALLYQYDNERTATDMCIAVNKVVEERKLGRRA